jgi:hypothetical protein
MHPACFPCRARKSRCEIRDQSSCVMCQAHSTDCVFPQAAVQSRRKRDNLRGSVSSKDNERVATTSLPAQEIRMRCLSSTSPTLSSRSLQSYSAQGEQAATVGAMDGHLSPSIGRQNNSISALIDLVAKSDKGSSHVVSPAIADDDRVFQEYLSNTSYGQSRRIVRFHLDLNNPSQYTRSILFNTVPKRGQREMESRSIAASNCEIIEKMVEPYQNDLIEL